jgi:DNA replication protein DnaC
MRGTQTPLQEIKSQAKKPTLPDIRTRAGCRVNTQLVHPDNWHSFIGDETVADAVCDRLVHNAHRLKLKGESIRKLQGLNTPKREAARA